MTKEDYIFSGFFEYNEKYNAENKDRLITKRVQEAKHDLVKLLDDEQYQAFRLYDNIRYMYSLTEREKFYREGFTSGNTFKDNA